jgi:hypothetical protein
MIEKQLTSVKASPISFTTLWTNCHSCCRDFCRRGRLYDGNRRLLDRIRPFSDFLDPNILSFLFTDKTAKVVAALKQFFVVVEPIRKEKEERKAEKRKGRSKK